MVERMAFSMTMPAAASSPVPTTPRPKTPHAHPQQQQQPSSYSQNHPHRQQTSPPPPPPSAHYVAHQPPSQTRSPSVPQNFTNHVAKLPAFDREFFFFQKFFSKNRKFCWNFWFLEEKVKLYWILEKVKTTEYFISNVIETANPNCFEEWNSQNFKNFCWKFFPSFFENNKSI